MADKFMGIGGTDGVVARPLRTNQKGELITQMAANESLVVINRQSVRDTSFFHVTIPDSIKKFPYYDVEIRNTLDSDVGIAFMDENTSGYRIFTVDGVMRQYDADLSTGRLAHVAKAKSKITHLSNMPTFVGNDIIEPIGGFNVWQNFDKNNLRIYFKAKTAPTTGDINVRLIGVYSK